MSVTTVYKYDNVDNYSYENTSIEVTDQARVSKLLVDPDEALYMSFKDGVEVYDRKKAGTVSLEFNSGGSISAEKLSVKDGYMLYNISGLSETFQRGCVRFKFIRGYEINPFGLNAQLLELRSQSGTDKIQLVHSISNTFRVFLPSATGKQYTDLGTFDLQFGVEYEIELGWDFTVGLIKLYVDGVERGADSLTGVVSSEMRSLFLFQGISGVVYSDLQLFSTGQHVSDFTNELPRVLDKTYRPGAHSIKPTNTLTTNELISIGETVTKPAGTDVKYALCVNGVLKYYDGNAWVDSDESEAQLNSIVELNNFDKLLLESNTLIKPVAFLISDGDETPELSELSLEYNLSPELSEDVNEAIVSLRLDDLSQDSFKGQLQGVLRAVPYGMFQIGDKIILDEEIVASFDSNGVAQMNLVQTEGTGSKVEFIAEINLNGKERKIRFEPVEIPNLSLVNLLSITKTKSMGLNDA